MTTSKKGGRLTSIFSGFLVVVLLGMTAMTGLKELDNDVLAVPGEKPLIYASGIKHESDDFSYSTMSESSDYVSNQAVHSDDSLGGKFLPKDEDPNENVTTKRVQVRENRDWEADRSARRETRKEVVRETKREVRQEVQKPVLQKQTAKRKTVKNENSRDKISSIQIAGRNLRVFRSYHTLTDSRNLVAHYKEKFLYGHNSKEVFGGLKFLRVGDSFTIVRNGRTEKYVIAKKQVLTKQDTARHMREFVRGAYLGVQYDLALMTCAGQSRPHGDATHRLNLLARRVR